MAKEPKYDLQYLYSSYKKKFESLDIDKANQYNDLAIKLHGADLREMYSAKLEAKEQKSGPFGLGRNKRVKYG